MALKEVDVRVEAVSLPHLNGEQVMVILLGLLTRAVLGDECLSNFHEVVERVWRQGVEPIQGLTFQAGRKSKAHDWIVTGVDYHLILKVSNVLNWITQSGV